MADRFVERRPIDREEQLQRLRAWLEHVAQTAIDWLDELDADAVDREPETEGPAL